MHFTAAYLIIVPLGICESARPDIYRTVDVNSLGIAVHIYCIYNLSTVLNTQLHYTFLPLFVFGQDLFWQDDTVRFIQ